MLFLKQTSKWEMWFLYDSPTVVCLILCDSKKEVNLCFATRFFLFPTGLYLLLHPSISKDIDSKKAIVRLFFTSILLLRRFISGFVPGSPETLCFFHLVAFLLNKANCQARNSKCAHSPEWPYSNFPKTEEDSWHSTILTLYYYYLIFFGRGL